MTAVDTHALPVSPWKNGAGATRSIAVSPPGASMDDFDWRVSIAEVASSAPFSRFPGIDRTILLLDGAGMILEIDGRTVSLATPFEPHRFSGDDQVRSRLLDGPSRDFNVMTRRGRSRADVEILRAASRLQRAADSAVFFCARGAFRLNETEIRSGWVLQVDRPGSEIEFVPQSPDALTIAVLITNLETS